MQGLEHKSPIKKGVTYKQPPCLQNSNASRQSGRGRTTHNRPVYNTPTIRRSGAGDDYTQLPSLQDSNIIAKQEGGDIHITALLTRLEHMSPVREGVTYTGMPCLQDSNTSRRSGRGRTIHNCPAYKTRTQVASQRVGEGELHTSALPTRLEHKSPVRDGGKG